VAKFSLRRYDTQAKVSIYIAIASVVTLLGQAFLVLQNISTQDAVIYYGPTRRMAVLGATATTLFLAVLAFGFGFNSVGQRRNDKQALSWAGFFVGAGVFCLSIIVYYLFSSRGEAAI
jgi:hypothetical protein